MFKATLALGLVAAATAEIGHLRLQKHTTYAHTRSRVVESLPNGSSIPADGSVWPTAIWWTSVEIGTPPQTFPVAIDSGSGDLDISGKGCDGCVTFPPNNQYDPRGSSTSRPKLPFAFSNTYQTCDLTDPTAPCTISGKLYTDQVSLAGLGPVKVALGSIEKQTSNFDQFKQIDGVMGFTMPSDKNVFSQLVDAGLCENIWAMCMTEGTKSNGTITIGGVDPRLSDNVAYVEDSGEGFHSVHVTSISVVPVAGKNKKKKDGAAVSGAVKSTFPVGQSAILDTGTNILLLGSKTMQGLKGAMCADTSLAHCDDLWDNKCVTLTEAEQAAYPGLAMELSDGVTLEMSAKDYLLYGSPLAPSKDDICLGIRDGGSAGGSGFIIGDTTMRNYYLVFDLKEKKIGWGPVSKQCGSI
jgi:cathepsin D